MDLKKILNAAKIPIIVMLILNIFIIIGLGGPYVTFISPVLVFVLYFFYQQSMKALILAASMLLAKLALILYLGIKVTKKLKLSLKDAGLATAVSIGTVHTFTLLAFLYHVADGSYGITPIIFLSFTIMLLIDLVISFAIGVCGSFIAKKF